MYMSPEQVTGRFDLDHRTDIYSLGMVLYELSRWPARSRTDPGGGPAQIVTKAMPPASWRNPALPRDLEGVLHKAAAKDPDDRYQTAADFAATSGAGSTASRSPRHTTDTASTCARSRRSGRPVSWSSPSPTSWLWAPRSFFCQCLY